jgi:hypothetical protein
VYTLILGSSRKRVPEIFQKNRPGEKHCKIIHFS